MTCLTKPEKLRLLAVLSALLTIRPDAAFGIQEYNLSKDRIRAIISSNKVNRIEFDAHGVAQVIGDSAGYQFITDNRGMNIFLQKQQLGKGNIELSVITNSGQAVDLVLTPVDNMEGQTIRIKSGLQDSVVKDAASIEIKRLLDAMIRDEESKYYVRHLRNDLTVNSYIPNLRIIQDRIYRYKQLIGTRLVVANKNRKQTLTIAKKDFSKIFENVVAVHIENFELAPGSKTHVWLVSKEVAND